MSMPAFPEPDKILSREEAVNSILTSIAMEEAALSHVINAEGEKIQHVLKRVNGNTDLQTILKINESASAMLEQISDIQFLLINKLKKILKHVPPDTEPHSGGECPPAKKPQQDKCPDKPRYSTAPVFSQPRSL